MSIGNQRQSVRLFWNLLRQTTLGRDRRQPTRRTCKNPDTARTLTGRTARRSSLLLRLLPLRCHHLGRLVLYCVDKLMKPLLDDDQVRHRQGLLSWRSVQKKSYGRAPASPSLFRRSASPTRPGRDRDTGLECLLAERFWGCAGEKIRSVGAEFCQKGARVHYDRPRFCRVMHAVFSSFFHLEKLPRFDLAEIKNRALNGI